MVRIASLVVVVLGLVSCVMDVTQDEKRWRALEGETVLIVGGYGSLVHGKKECPDLAHAKGEIKIYTVKGGRLTDAAGTFFGSERERQPLCPSCVK